MKHNLVGSAGAAQPAQQNRTVVRCLPGDWTAGPVPNITASHQRDNYLRGNQRRDPGVQVLTPNNVMVNRHNSGVMTRPPDNSPAHERSEACADFAAAGS